MATSENAAKKPKAMTKKLLQHFEKRLLEERKRVLKELGQLRRGVRRDVAGIATAI